MKDYNNRRKKNSLYEHVYPFCPVCHLPPDGVVSHAYLLWRATIWSPVKVDFHAAYAARCLQALLCSPDGFFFFFLALLTSQAQQENELKLSKLMILALPIMNAHRVAQRSLFWYFSSSLSDKTTAQKVHTCKQANAQHTQTPALFLQVV